MASKSGTRRRPLSSASIKLAEQTQAFRDFLSTADTAFAALPQSDQNSLSGLLFQAHIGNFSHNSGEDDLFPIHWEAKQKKFGSAAHFDKLNATVGWFSKVRGAKVGTSAEGWKMTDKAKELLAEYHDQGKQQHLPFYDLPDSARQFVDREGRPCRKPQSPIASKASNGTNTKFKAWELPLNVTIDGNNLHAFLSAAEARFHGDSCPRGFEWAWKTWDDIENSSDRDTLLLRLSETIAQAAEFLKTAWVSKLKGFVVHQSYEESTSGRLVAQGVLNLQNCHREVRQACLPGHYDYDIECCHYALLASLAKRQGFIAHRINEYISDKNKLRREVQMAIGGTLDNAKTLDDAKAIITSLIYGAPLTDSPQGSIAQRVGVKGAKRLLELHTLAALNADLKEARGKVLEAHRGEVERTGRITNAAGRRIQAKGVKANKLLAHILTGEESEVLKVSIAFTSAHIALLAHDGFVTTQPIDKAALSARIEKATGHKLSIACKPFAPPAV